MNPHVNCNRYTYKQYCKSYTHNTTGIVENRSLSLTSSPTSWVHDLFMDEWIDVEHHRSYTFLFLAGTDGDLITDGVYTGA